MSFELEKIEMSEEEFNNKKEEFGEIIKVFEDVDPKSNNKELIDPDACVKEVKTKSNNSKPKQKTKTATPKAAQKKPLQDNLVRQTYIITDDIKWALKRKAAFEKREVNIVLREILSKEIEGKYFD